MATIAPTLSLSLNDTPRERHAAKFCKFEFFASRMRSRFSDQPHRAEQIIQAMRRVDKDYQQKKGTKVRKNGDSHTSHHLRMVGRADHNDENDYRLYLAIVDHDSMEDLGYTFAMLAEMHGEEVATIICAVSKDEISGIPPREQSNRTFVKIASLTGVLLILTIKLKLLDREDSFEFPWEGGEDNLEFKAEQSLRYLVDLALDNGLDWLPLLRAIVALTDWIERRRAMAQ